MEYITLSQLNLLIREEIETAFPGTYWLIAETSDVRLNKNGHCYLEFIEKKESDNNIIAKARGYIWANTYQLLKPYFEEKTGQSFVSGLKILVNVSVDFHPVYGYGLNVCDIDPTYTAGDMQQHRQQILNRLEKEGILSLNKELEMPLLPQKIAVITSPTAAGYEDFINHLENNKHGFVFYTHLFPAVMQGEQTEKSIISALNTIYENRETFDAVVIIRGGGATSDLASFDTYSLAANCAQFPLPVITGIGHERDDTVLDFISKYRAKTPTAVADYLLAYLENAFSALCKCQSNLIFASNRMLDSSFEEIQQLTRHLHLYVYNTLERQNLTLCLIKDNLQKFSKQFFTTEEIKLREKASFFKLSSPEYILSKGYSVTLKDGKVVKSAQTLQDGDAIETILKEGKISSIVSFRT
ncbi:MAG: exodeoxyribonuclease VII large subunit [Dysgonamonadaceae bacterium]|jgi:exodeoxyribonuclease VII large subunit|nr:exodeoxyribonuclease VII large subunit [Dysgonamonadaceae bacterium]